MNDMIDLRQHIRDEQVASVKIAMLEELISVMNKVRFYLDSLEGSAFEEATEEQVVYDENDFVEKPATPPAFSKDE